jgi:hypothetical protein
MSLVMIGLSNVGRFLAELFVSGTLVCSSCNMRSIVVSSLNLPESFGVEVSCLEIIAFTAEDNREDLDALLGRCVDICSSGTGDESWGWLVVWTGDAGTKLRDSVQIGGALLSNFLINFSIISSVFKLALIPFSFAMICNSFLGKLMRTSCPSCSCLSACIL